ncbi:MAG TPA: PAS domain-containing protein [bacterium]|nr:PAS domain-containing protein [bacterium]
MGDHEWADELGVAITVCDREGIIIEMNEASRAVFVKYGGAALLGTNVLDCHPEPARTQLARMLAEGTTNTYTIEKNGKKKLIYQTPWKRDGRVMGLVEISLPLPDDLAHHRRD